MLLYVAMNPSREYLKNLPLPEKEKLAALVQTKAIYLYQIGISFRSPSKKLQFMLESATKGKIKASDFDEEIKECLAISI